MGGQKDPQKKKKGKEFYGLKSWVFSYESWRLLL
jgi:hypothetical protein